MKIRYLLLLSILLFVGCQSEVSKPINDDRIRELAWSELNESEKSSIVESREDIIYEDQNITGVTTLINNAPPDVWKRAEVKYLNENEVKEIAQKFKANLKSNIAQVNYKFLLGESSNTSYEPIKVYIDIYKGVVIGKEQGKINAELQF